MGNLLNIENLNISFGNTAVVHDVSFTVKKGAATALIGESGSGKSITALSILKLLPPSAHVSGNITYNDENISGADERLLKSLRGDKIGMVFQEPMTSLNPLHTIGKQIGEMIELHQPLGKKQIKARILELLDLVQLPRLKDRLDAYPHELSGGQRQRIMIAMAIANNPDLLIADEPTTALDVTVEAEIMELLKKLQRDLDMSILFISHDLPLVERFAEHLCVMKDGEIVEQGTTKDIFKNPQHDYTKKLLAARPEGLVKPLNKKAEILAYGSNILVEFPLSRTFFGKPKTILSAVNDVSLTVRQGETLGVVGESGSGKTTLGKALLRLTPSKGTIVFAGQNVPDLDKHALKTFRSNAQIVFQDPFGSLSPRMSVGNIIAEGLSVHKKHLSATERDDLVIKALQDVELDPDSRHRYPHEFSGGQRQRISIARALILDPQMIVMDEPTSALDMSVQVGVINLLRRIQETRGIAYIFISHDLRVIRAMSHNILVMKDGQQMEYGPVSQIFDAPETEYTKRLITAAGL